MNDRDQLIEKYINGELSGEELTQFEGDLQQSEELQQQVAIHRLAVSGIQDVGKKLDKEEMAQWEAEKHPLARERKLALGIWYRVAAVILLLLIPTYFWLSQESRLYDQHYSTLPNYLDPSERGVDKALDKRREGLLSYEKGNFQEAIVSFNDYLDEFSGDGDVALYKALSLQAMENHEAAIEFFRYSLDQGTQFEMAATWYLSLSYLALNKKEEAKALLKNLSQEDSSFADKAKMLLDDI